MAEFRRVPMRRLIARLGLGEFNNVGPLVDHSFSPQKVKILLKQHAGLPAVPVVKCGDRVHVGDLLAAPEQGKLGARLHASIDGVVTVGRDAIVIERREQGPLGP
jgi:Na+-translocating ferredoxin:NAD+ oxidoreductase RnfC subunit